MSKSKTLSISKSHKLSIKVILSEISNNKVDSVEDEEDSGKTREEEEAFTRNYSKINKTSRDNLGAEEVLVQINKARGLDLAVWEASEEKEIV